MKRSLNLFMLMVACLLAFVPAAAAQRTEETIVPSTENLTSVTSVDEVLGIWHWHPGGFYFSFDAEGQFAADERLEGVLSAMPQDLGTYSLSDGIMTLVSGASSQHCAAGDAGVYDVFSSPTGELALMMREDACAQRAPDLNVLQMFDFVTPDHRFIRFPTGQFDGALAGIPFEYEFLAVGSFEIRHIDDTGSALLVTQGVFEVNRDELTILEDSYCTFRGVNEPVTYTWSFLGGDLVLNPMAPDQCVSRMAFLEDALHR